MVWWAVSPREETQQGAQHGVPKSSPSLLGQWVFLISGHGVAVLVAQNMEEILGPSRNLLRQKLWDRQAQELL